MTNQTYKQYIDQESAVVKKPEGEGWSDAYGDGVWRSSWFYASLLVIRHLDPGTYQWLQTTHGVNAALVGQFLTYFRNHCLSDHGWQLPKQPEQQFSRDQLMPLLYLLGVVAAYAPEYQGAGGDILRSLGRLEEHGRGVSDSHKGRIGRNIGYLIDVLSDQQRYNMTYRTADMDIWRATALFNEKQAKKNRRAFYKAMFSLALKAHNLSAQFDDSLAGGILFGIPVKLEVTDEYSVFNALAAVSLQCVAWGKEDSDVQAWRANFKLHADDGWGPAFRIVAGRSVTPDVIEIYRTAHVTRDQDNDIIMAQRPGKIRDGRFDLTLSGEDGEWLVLDYVVLKALDWVWA
jgi:hypothetical protein